MRTFIPISIDVKDNLRRYCKQTGFTYSEAIEYLLEIEENNKGFGAMI